MERPGWATFDCYDFIDASAHAIGVPFDDAVVASEIGSYKPAPGHWRVFAERTGADHDRHVHVAQSHFHDVVPATELGLRTVWINRLDERARPAPTRELPDLVGLPDVLDELVRATPGIARTAAAAGVGELIGPRPPAGEWTLSER